VILGVFYRVSNVLLWPDSKPRELVEWLNGI